MSLAKNCFGANSLELPSFTIDHEQFLALGISPSLRDTLTPKEPEDLILSFWGAKKSQ